jgi:enoyl-CoA hydratase/carnithine racemase
MTGAEGETANVASELDGGVGILRLDRPHRLNALDDATLLELTDRLEEWEWDAQVAAVLLTSEGRAFSAGSDIKEMAGYDERQLARHQVLGTRLCDRMTSSRLPIVAAIRGYALGGGLEIALAADLRIAGESAVLGTPEVELNAIPSWGGTQRLPALVGLGRAAQLVLTGEKIDAATALAWGLVNEVVADDELESHARELCRRLAGLGPAVGTLKALLRRGAAATPPSGLALEALADALASLSPEFKGSVGGFGQQA